MSKSQVKEFLEHVYRAIFADARYAYPTMEAEFEKDLSRLLCLVERRGIRVYLIDLPAVAKHLDRCLDNGSYKLSGLPLTKRFSGRVVIPKFLRGLYLRVFNETGSLREDCDFQAIFFLRQILCAAKKVKLDCSADVVEATVLDFISVDAELPEPEGYWEATEAADLETAPPYIGFCKSGLLKDRLQTVPLATSEQTMSIFLRVLDVVSSIITTTLGPYRADEWRFRHGPGAISEAVGPTNKYCWSNWSDALESEYPIADFGYHSHSSWAGSCDNEGYRGRSISCVEPTSRLVAVPKTFGGPRLIAAEPSEHQWCQQNAWHYMRRRTSASGIRLFVRFTDQSRNQELCSEASREGTLATVDLSAASDRVTCHVVGQFFRSNPGLLSALRASRTRSVSQALSSKGVCNLRLRKYSTMGSACTFPVESLVFLGITLAAVLTKRQLKPTWNNIRRLADEVAVFGDDIIVPVDSRELLFDALGVLYFKVNSHKSFWTGGFRESCGLDAYKGFSVTPAYVRRVNDGKPEALASTLGTCNNFYNRFMLHTASFLASTLPGMIPMVSMNSGVAGLKSRCGIDNTRLRRRYSQHLQQDETRIVGLQAKQLKSPTNDDTALLQYFTERPDPLSNWVHGIAQRPKLQQKFRWVPTSSLAPQSQVM